MDIQNKIGRIKLEDILFWILIATIIMIALWMLQGSPKEENALTALALFVAGSELLLWRALFKTDKITSIKFEKIDKKITLSFERIGSDINNLKSNIDNQLKEVKNLIRKK